MFIQNIYPKGIDLFFFFCWFEVRHETFFTARDFTRMDNFFQELYPNRL